MSRPSDHQSIVDYLIRGRNYWERSPHIKEQFPDPNSPDFARHIDTEAVLYLKEIQESGIPFPRWKDMLNVGGETDLRKFLSIGYQCYEMLRKHLEPAGEVKKVLDWGVGCGRTARHFFREQNHFKIYGCDPDSSSIEYLQQDVDFVDACISNNNPPLPYKDGMFDYIYGISIFTHLSEDPFREWIKELTRVLTVGGRALLTFHGTVALNKVKAGTTSLEQLLVDTQAFQRDLPNFDRRGFLWAPQNVISEDVDASQFGISFTDERRLSEFLPSNLRLVDYLPGEIGEWQDLAIFERV